VEQRTEPRYIFLLTGEELLALVRVLRVVQDNWWLDDVEGTLLERLDGADAVFLPAA
jgi:hypothetical protein